MNQQNQGDLFSRGVGSQGQAWEVTLWDAAVTDAFHSEGEKDLVFLFALCLNPAGAGCLTKWFIHFGHENVLEHSVVQGRLAWMSNVEKHPADGMFWQLPKVPPLCCWIRASSYAAGSPFRRGQVAMPFSWKHTPSALYFMPALTEPGSHPLILSSDPRGLYSCCFESCRKKQA